MSLLVASLLAAILSVQCKVYERCELARELDHVHGLKEVATWVCIAQHESLFNTSAVNRGSGDHGLFQISELFWCSPPGNGFACNAPCSAFEDDDIADDVRCIRKIHKEHEYLSGNGFNAWVVYQLYCKGDVSKYVEGCFDGATSTSTSTSTTPEPDDDGYNFPPLPSPPKKAAKKAFKGKTYSKRPAVSTAAPAKSTRKPLEFVYENVHTDRKREQKLQGTDSSEYSFLWKSNGFRLVRN